MPKLPRALLRYLPGARAPLSSGVLSLAGPIAPISIRRDRFAIPSIDAENDADAWFGLGFCQAQDRAFQLELRLRTARGTLSELFGEQTLPIDRLSRRIGFTDASQRQLPVLHADIRAQVEAFAAGLNAGLATAIAPEFALLRANPTRWLLTDVLNAGKLISFLMIGNWDVELSRLKILQTDGPNALRDLDPAHPSERLPAAVAALDALSDDLARYLAFAGAGGGSNNWAIAGSRTASGRPILASDPHLDPSLPPHWYLARLRTPVWSVAGASLIGGPAIGIGHNGFAAWSLTAGLADTVDLFVETPSPDGRSVLRGDAYEACEVRREVIEVRNRTSVIEDVLVTPRGPVIGPALEGDLGAISISATWLRPRPVRGFLVAHLARSLDEFRRGFEHWPLLSANVVYADTSGAIAWQLVGEAPIRKAGFGTLPQPAADPSTGWQEASVPFRDMPHLIDPPAGFVASANSAPPADASMPYLGVDWLDSYRYSRIAEALTARSDWTLDATARLQLDRLSLAWREVRDAILATPALTADAARALTLLRDWDGSVASDSIAATIYEVFLAEMRRRIGASRAPNAAAHAIGLGFTPLLTVTTFTAGRGSRILRALREQPDGWFARGWPAELSDALATTARLLRDRLGPDESAWRWGHARPISVVKPLAPYLNRGPYPWGGDGNTISQASSAPWSPLESPGNIASLRMVVELGDWDNARFVLPGGQSGNPLSPHYDDMIPLWLRGEGVPIAWSPAATERATVSTLTLLPLP